MTDIAASPPHKERILIADDDHKIRGLMERALGEAEYNIVAAATGEEALEICEESTETVDLALLDFDMPGINGLETAKILIEKHHIPFVIVSQFDDKDVVNQAVEAGAMGYLVKPVLPENIVPAVRTALQRAKEHQTDLDRWVMITQELSENRNVLRKIIEEDEDNRSHLVRELHDDLGHRFTNLAQRASLIKHLIENRTLDDDTYNKIVEVCNSISKSSFEGNAAVKSIVKNLKPAVFLTLQLGSAIHHEVREWGSIRIGIDVDVSSIDTSIANIPDPVGPLIYRVT